MYWFSVLDCLRTTWPSRTPTSRREPLHPQMDRHLLGVAFVLFWFTRSIAKAAPKTMNAQYQEMTNEYLRVSHSSQQPAGVESFNATLFTHILSYTMEIGLGWADEASCRTKIQNPSPVSHRKAIRAKGWCRVNHGKEAYHQMTTNRTCGGKPVYSSSWPPYLKLFCWPRSGYFLTRVSKGLARKMDG